MIADNEIKGLVFRNKQDIENLSDDIVNLDDQIGEIRAYIKAKSDDMDGIEFDIRLINQEISIIKATIGKILEGDLNFFKGGKK